MVNSLWFVGWTILLMPVHADYVGTLVIAVSCALLPLLFSPRYPNTLLFSSVLFPF